MSGRDKCIRAADEWDRLATSAEEMAAWERQRGIDTSMPGGSVGDRRAAQYRKAARTLRLEAETGEPHCMCHEQPVRLCPVRNNKRVTP